VGEVFGVGQAIHGVACASSIVPVFEALLLLESRYYIPLANTIVTRLCSDPYLCRDARYFMNIPVRLSPAI